MQKNLLFVLTLLVISFIFYQGFRYYPFATRSDPMAPSDRKFFDPDQDHFFDLETQ